MMKHMHTIRISERVFAYALSGKEVVGLGGGTYIGLKPVSHAELGDMARIFEDLNIPDPAILLDTGGIKMINTSLFEAISMLNILSDP